MNRVFISYRTSDGRDKATALARDLARVFGAQQVFLDKDDLRGGAPWREAIASTLSGRPVLLLLVTPELLAARDAAGALRIADPDDPVRREVQSALDHHGTLIPVLCDGVDAPPDAATLPPPFHGLGALTWRRLRAYDWEGDVQRLVEDLRGHGVEPIAPPRQRRWIAGAGLVIAAAAAVGGWVFLRRPSWQGEWKATLVRGEQTLLVLSGEGETVRLASHPVPVAAREDWAEYRSFWKERTGTELEAVVYRGEGRFVTAPGESPQLDIGFKVHSRPGDEPVDGGNLALTLAADGRWRGRIWLNGAQAEWPAQLER